MRTNSMSERVDVEFERGRINAMLYDTFLQKVLKKIKVKIKIWIHWIMTTLCSGTDLLTSSEKKFRGM